ncbi:unnamed protein product [Coregonus sp. 'balchen']|nr:unnamed protein product [Coregonus sp. 'balchen']
MDPLAKPCPSQAEHTLGKFSGRLTALEAAGEDSESGCGEEEAMGGSDTFSSLVEMEVETLEQKLKGLAFRKQTSYSPSGSATDSPTELRVTPSL